MTSTIEATNTAVAGCDISFQNIGQTFPTPAGPTVALESFDLDIKAGEFVALVGPSGCGKTTAMNIAAGLVKPSSGTVKLGESAPKLGNYDVGYLLARDCLQPWRTAAENVMLPLEIRGVPRRQARATAAEHLESVGLGHAGASYPAQLSHGMRQRVAVARTLAFNPKVVLFDEPFSALDAQTKINLQDLLIGLWEKHRSTVMFITHDLSEAVTLADRVVVMSAHPGRILKEFRIDLERPRSALDLQGDPLYHEYYQEIWSIIKTEMSEH
ncbi:ABC transporter ATP-binding protein [Pseudarthrobacter sp. H2]|uniref:ABC transporter ATP-binding protein n=1 Tax=Pseudarthrobacter sp. H2 TaxID=3418415 RepID=UPI003CFAF739